MFKKDMKSNGNTQFDLFSIKNSFLAIYNEKIYKII